MMRTSFTPRAASAFTRSARSDIGAVSTRPARRERCTNSASSSASRGEVESQGWICRPKPVSRQADSTPFCTPMMWYGLGLSYTSPITNGVPLRRLRAVASGS